MKAALNVAREILPGEKRASNAISTCNRHVLEMQPSVKKISPGRKNADAQWVYGIKSQLMN